MQYKLITTIILTHLNIIRQEKSCLSLNVSPIFSFTNFQLLPSHSCDLANSRVLSLDLFDLDCRILSYVLDTDSQILFHNTLSHFYHFCDLVFSTHQFDLDNLVGLHDVIDIESTRAFHQHLDFGYANPPCDYDYAYPLYDSVHKHNRTFFYDPHANRLYDRHENHHYVNRPNLLYEGLDLFSHRLEMGC